MGKIKVKDYNNGPYDGNPCGDVTFSLVSSPKDGRRQIMGWMLCKAYIHDAVTSHVTGLGDHGGHYSKGKNPPIDMNKLRLLIGTRDNGKDMDEFKKKLFAAKKMVNVLEKAAGWKPSKITTVEHETVEKGVWLLTGPKQWMMSPHMLSMVTLILRIGVRKGPIKVNNKEQALKQLEEWANSEKGRNPYSGVSYDVKYIRACWTKLFPIMENFDDLFDGISLKEAYDPGAIHMHSNGIEYLGKFHCGCEELNERLKRLVEK